MSPNRPRSEASQIRYVDLALDLLVFPDGRQLVLDEDEFEALHPEEFCVVRHPRRWPS